MKKFRFWIEYVGLLILQWCVARMPFLWLRHLGAFVGSIAYYCDFRGRKVSLANITAAFGDKYTPAQRARIARKSYCVFARTMIEMLWSPNITRDFALNVCNSQWTDGKERTEMPDRGVIHPCIHFSNFNWLTTLGAYSVGIGSIISAQYENPYLGPFLEKLRACTGNPVVPKDRALIHMFKILQRGGRFGSVADVTLDVRKGGVVISTFGGLLMSVAPSHAALAQRTGAQIEMLECMPREDGYYTIMRHPPFLCGKDEDLTQCVQKCWDVFEKTIVAHPECWLWSYKYWRTMPATGDNSRFPFYANVGPYFPDPRPRE